MNKLFIIAVFVILAALWGIQGFFAYCQVKDVQKNYKEIYNAYINCAKKYFFGMGNVKGYISKGCIIFIVADLNGNIVHSRILDGRSVFDRFRIYDDIIGKNIYSFIIEEEKRREPKNIFNNKNASLTPKEKAILMASKNIDNFLKENKKKTALNES